MSPRKGQKEKDRRKTERREKDEGNTDLLCGFSLINWVDNVF
jgi:hypothetical protein